MSHDFSEISVAVQWLLNFQRLELIKITRSTPTKSYFLEQLKQTIAIVTQVFNYLEEIQRSVVSNNL